MIRSFLCDGKTQAAKSRLVSRKSKKVGIFIVLSSLNYKAGTSTSQGGFLCVFVFVCLFALLLFMEGFKFFSS